MPVKFLEDLEPGTLIYQGTRGGEYVLTEDGRRIYISRAPRPKWKPQRNFRPKRGAFLRFIENQANIS